MAKKKLGAYLIIGIFFMSTIAYVASYNFHGGTGEDVNPENYFNIDGSLDRNIEISLLNNGITLVRVFYKDDSYKTIANNLTEITSSYTGLKQVAIQRISSDSNYVVIENYQNSERLNPTVDTLASDVCEFLLYETPNCILE